MCMYAFICFRQVNSNGASEETPATNGCGDAEAGKKKKKKKKNKEQDA